MKINQIKNNEDLQAALARIDQIWEAEEGTPEFDELDVLCTLIEAYEAKHYPIDPPDPIEAIRFRMEQEQQNG